jgi:protease IV
MKNIKEESMLIPRFSSTTILVVLLISLAGSLALAQDINPTGGVLLPSPSITETNDATALATNPANLAFLDSWNFTYVGSWLSDHDHLVGQGHGFFFAFPLGPLALGLGLEPLKPPGAVAVWQGLDDRARFSLGLAFNFQRVFALGLSYRTFFFYERGEIHTLDLALTVHPVNFLSLSFVISDVNSPEYGYAPLNDMGIRSLITETAPRRFNVGLTIRPFSNDRLSVGGEMGYLWGEVAGMNYRRTDASALLTVMPIKGLTLRGRFGAEGIRDDTLDPGYFVDASLAIDFSGFGLGVSMHGQISPEDAQAYEGTTWAVRFSGDEAPSLTFPEAIRATHVAIIDIKDRMDSHALTSMVDLFERMNRDSGLDMVVLRPRPGTMSLSTAREMRTLISRMQATGRKVVSYLTEATGSVYLGCAGSDQVWINPAGGIRLAGISTKRLYFRNLFDKIGVKADMVRIGEYKSAPESFTKSKASGPDEAQMNRYLDSIYEHLLASLAVDRGLDNAEAAGAIVEKGPFTASEALSSGLVDRIVPQDTFGEQMKELVGRPLYFDDSYGKSKERHRRYLDSPAVAVVHIDGDLVDGESLSIPFFNIKMTGAETLAKTLRKIKEDSRIRAVVLRIDSPGGSVLASDIIWREIMALKKEKKVIASMAGVAASGGYYIATAADEIYADATTLTGSIGIFYGKADLSGLLDKVGVGVTTFKRGLHADAQSWTRPYTAEERKRLLDQIGQYYSLFKQRIIEGRGRGFNADIVERLARGRIWSGSDAKYHLLVDHVGGYSKALDRARELGNIPSDIRVFQYPKPKRNLIVRLLKSMTASVREQSPLEILFSGTGLRRMLRAVVPFAISDPASPQARLPFGIISED